MFLGLTQKKKYLKFKNKALNIPEEAIKKNFKWNTDNSLELESYQRECSSKLFFALVLGHWDVRTATPTFEYTKQKICSNPTTSKRHAVCSNVILSVLS